MYIYGNKIRPQEKRRPSINWYVCWYVKWHGLCLFFRVFACIGRTIIIIWFEHNFHIWHLGERCAVHMCNDYYMTVQTKSGVLDLSLHAVIYSTVKTDFYLYFSSLHPIRVYNSALQHGYGFVSPVLFVLYGRSGHFQVVLFKKVFYHSIFFFIPPNSNLVYNF